MQINKLITPYNHYNGRGGQGIKYIVIHYVGALGGAKENCQYYASGDVGASAHYYVGFSGEIWQSVEDANGAWSVGGGRQSSEGGAYYGQCTNYNSLSIEMCVHKRNHNTMNATDRDWYFEDATVKSAVELTKYLMSKYGIPADRVIRHYDVNGKTCPNPYVYNHTKHTWAAFKAALAGASTEPAPQPSKPDEAGIIYRVQTGAFKDKKLADSFAATLKSQGFETCIKQTESLYKVQIGAFSMKANADSMLKKLQSYGYGGFVTGGDTVEAKEKTVKVTTDVLNIRTGPGTSYTLSGQITDRGTYTIVETSGNWGKLKSGAGWICLDYTRNS
ncbi:N-acetylmuramoyl-L-alanine amidase [Murimonas intestini]|uniref:N-acetylmuramoyl-L-alanine amidase n=1 Tax=Murimonas intestini TaxID=1337051 RepID=A0AB73SZH3_9FIRM|nr:N-acetylmuramoyl-L-alanine amidase [Murimonas intestini]MCR1842746.1 SPOR domain-containing protein [Murimonas intestini]MCR1867915.1 SPOR domain-containing protein [Murimonas intestini]MCR1885267.1 SPOR domain-containing protein [Murimonas intestini]